MKSEVKIDGNRLEMTRVFDAPRDRVFEAWKRADLVQQWWGCAEATRVESQIDFRVGGTFSHKMQIEGCGEHAYSGSYDEIAEPERIAWHAQSQAGTERVVAEFIDEGETTKLVLTQELPGPEACQIVAQGFAVALDKLAALLSRALA